RIATKRDLCIQMLAWITPLNNKYGVRTHSPSSAQRGVNAFLIIRKEVTVQRLH
ncbi:hypothetical protein CDAR_488491, partial [Caerostris darwini]